MKVLTFASIALVALFLGIAADRSPANDVRVVRFDVAVTDKDGNPVTGLLQTDFKVFEDNVEQNITSFRQREEPLAIVILEEFSDAFYPADAIKPAETLVRNLQPQDWIALVSFDSKPEIVVDFTHDRTAVIAGLRRLEMPYSREASLYDALYFVLDRFNRIELKEKKAIVLLGTGRDTFNNRHSYADVLKRAAASGTMIYTVGVEQSPVIANYPDRDPGARIRANEAANTLRALAEATGGLSFFPQFEGQNSAIHQAVNADLRHQYTLGFMSSSTKGNGKLRKLRVEVSDTDINHDGKPDKLRVRNPEGHFGG